MTCLVFLSHGKSVTAAQISSHSGMDKMSVSDLVKTLLKKGLILRSKNQSDSRSFVIKPTKLGFSLTNSSVKKVEAIDEIFFSSLKNSRLFSGELLTLIRASSQNQ
jgi:DNA-binding MarR family transcriptional regulator